MTDLATLRTLARDIFAELIVATPENFEGLRDQLDATWDMIATEMRKPVVVVDPPHDPPPPPPPPPTVRTPIILGHCVDALPNAEHELPLEGMRLLRAMGPSIPRLNIHSELVMRSDGTYDFARLGRDLATLRAAGFEEVLLNPMWLPRHITMGVPINEPYETRDWTHDNDCTVCGSADSNAAQHQKDAPHSHGYTPRGPRYFTVEERPWLYPPNHPPIDSDAIRDYGMRLAEYVRAAFGGAIRFYISFWNEPDIFDYYPQANQTGTYLNAARRPLYLEMWVPFMRGWKRVLPDTPIVGWDSASPGNADLYFQLQQEYSATDPTWPKIDVASFHVYGPLKPPTIASSINEVTREGGYMDVIRRYYKEDAIPPLWATEFASDPDSPTAEWCKALLDLKPQIIPFPYLCSRYFMGGNDAWDHRVFGPNDEYRAMQRVAQMEVARRRAARS